MLRAEHDRTFRRAEVGAFCQPDVGLRVMESVDGDRVLWAASEPQAVPVLGGDALSRVFEAEYGRLVRLASLFVDTYDEAEEVVQEAFARTLAGWSRVRDKDDATAYIRRAVVNLCHGRLRRRRLVRRLRPDDPGVAFRQNMSSRTRTWPSACGQQCGDCLFVNANASPFTT